MATTPPVSIFKYSDWITFPEGSPTRLQRLRLHIQEVSNQIAGGDYAIEGRSVEKRSLQEYLAGNGLAGNGLLEREKFEATQVGLTQGTRIGFTQLRARRRP